MNLQEQINYVEAFSNNWEQNSQDWSADEMSKECDKLTKFCDDNQVEHLSADDLLSVLKEKQEKLEVLGNAQAKALELLVLMKELREDYDLECALDNVFGLRVL